MIKGEEDPSFGTERDGSERDSDKEYLHELFNFSCVLRGEVKHLEKIKEHIISEYVDKGLVKLIKPTYDKKEIYILTREQWKEYQKLKRDRRLTTRFSYLF